MTELQIQYLKILGLVLACRPSTAVSGICPQQILVSFGRSSPIGSTTPVIYKPSFSFPPPKPVSSWNLFPVIVCLCALPKFMSFKNDSSQSIVNNRRRNALQADIHSIYAFI